MKSIFGRSLVIASLAHAAMGGLCLAVDNGSKAEAAPTPGPSAAQRIKFPPNRSIENYLGPAVRGANGQRLAEVRDVLVDERTSRLAIAVVGGAVCESFARIGSASRGPDAE